MDMGFSELFKDLKNELLEKAKSMEKPMDFKDLDRPIAKILGNGDDCLCSENKVKPLEKNFTNEIDGNEYETDDNGDIYKINGELKQNTSYQKNGIIYSTDENGRISTWKGEPKYEPENERDTDAQTKSGGEDRKEGDDGGHVVARILGGSAGSENIVPMRDTINRGDYKKSENEIVEATKQGNNVQDSGKVIYEEDSVRPSKIERTYTIDGEISNLKVDNIEGSKDLLDDLEGEISKQDIDSLKDEIADMDEDKCNVSVTSVLKKYNEDGNLVSVSVGIRNETTGEKTYRTFES